MTISISSILHAHLKQCAKDCLRYTYVRRALKPLSTRGAMSEEEIAAFHDAWGNSGFSADKSFLAQLLKLLGHGSVLECGSGGTSLLSGLMGQRVGFKTYCLEQSSAWALDVRQWGLKSVEILETPLKDYGTYRWYDVPAGLPSHFSVIICDGPFISRDHGEPHYSSWRYGLLPWLEETNRTFDTLLLDDVNDPRAPAVLQRWQTEFAVTVERMLSSDGELAVIRPSPALEVPAAVESEVFAVAV